jgi:hypothetical protein
MAYATSTGAWSQANCGDAPMRRQPGQRLGMGRPDPGRNPALAQHVPVERAGCRFGQPVPSPGTWCASTLSRNCRASDTARTKTPSSRAPPSSDYGVIPDPRAGLAKATIIAVEPLMVRRWNSKSGAGCSSSLAAPRVCGRAPATRLRVGSRVPVCPRDTGSARSLALPRPAPLGCPVPGSGGANSRGASANGQVRHAIFKDLWEKLADGLDQLVQGYRWLRVYWCLGGLRTGLDHPHNDAGRLRHIDHHSYLGRSRHWKPGDRSEGEERREMRSRKLRRAGACHAPSSASMARNMLAFEAM